MVGLHFTTPAGARVEPLASVPIAARDHVASTSSAPEWSAGIRAGSQVAVGAYALERQNLAAVP